MRRRAGLVPAEQRILAASVFLSSDAFLPLPF
jgi:hypothetical protein